MSFEIMFDNIFYKYTVLYNGKINNCILLLYTLMSENGHYFFVYFPKGRYFYVQTFQHYWECGPIHSTTIETHEQTCTQLENSHPDVVDPYSFISLFPDGQGAGAGHQRAIAGLWIGRQRHGHDPGQGAGHEAPAGQLLAPARCHARQPAGL